MDPPCRGSAWSVWKRGRCELTKDTDPDRGDRDRGAGGLRGRHLRRRHRGPGQRQRPAGPRDAHQRATSRGACAAPRRWRPASLDSTPRSPQEFVPDNYIPPDALETILTKAAVSDLAPGQVLVEDMFVDPADCQITAARRLAEGNVAITICVDDVRGVAGLIVPGDFVNIMVAQDNCGGGETPEARAETAPAGHHGRSSAAPPGCCSRRCRCCSSTPDPMQLPGEAATDAEGEAATAEAVNTGLITFQVPPAAAQLIASVPPDGFYLTPAPADLHSRSRCRRSTRTSPCCPARTPRSAHAIRPRRLRGRRDPLITTAWAAPAPHLTQKRRPTVSTSDYDFGTGATGRLDGSDGAPPPAGAACRSSSSTTTRRSAAGWPCSSASRRSPSASIDELQARLTGTRWSWCSARPSPRPMGLADAERLVAEHPEVGALLVAAELTTELFRQALRAGIKDVLAAPVDTAGLAESVRRIAGGLGRRASRARGRRRRRRRLRRVGQGHHRLLDQGRRRQVGHRHQPGRACWPGDRTGRSCSSTPTSSSATSP